MQIRGSCILITGASSGIGAACARAAARQGARVVLLARTRSALEQLAADIRAAGGRADVYPVDLTDAAATTATIERVLAEVGTPEIVISNAGAGRWLFLEETTPDEAVAMMAMPYFAAFYLTRALLPAMLRQNRGLLVYVNSPAALAPWPGATAYTAARWALRGLAEALRADLHGTGVRVSTIIPGRISSSYFDNNPGVLDREPGVSRRLLPTLSPEQAADRIMQAIARDQRLAIFPVQLKLLYLIHYVLPGAVRWLAARTGARRPAQP